MAIKQKNNSLPFFRIGSTPRQKIYLGTNLVYNIESPPPPTFIEATGGTITTSGGYRIHTFSSAATSSFVITSLSNTPANNFLEVLAVGGGGGGGQRIGGGGGAGGVSYTASVAAAVQSYTTVVGFGGAGGGASASGNAGQNGGDTVFGSIATAVGGGGGAFYNNATPGGNGGSGGGGGGYNATGRIGGSGTVGQGSAGGNGDNSTSSGGGGGGANAVGGVGASGQGGSGGNGIANSITGTSVTYGGGGGGASDSATYEAPGGSGGGGKGGRGLGPTNTAPVAGTHGLGGGGGAYRNSDDNGSGVAAAGGSGVLIIKYPYGGWDPSLMTGNAYWWRADTGVALSGATVTSWTDQISGSVLTGAGTPTFASSIAGMNSQPGITFDTSDRLTLNSLANPQDSSSDSLVFWWVIDTGTNGSGGYQILGGAAVGGTGEWVFETNNPSFANSYTNYFFDWLGFPNGDKNYGVSVQATERAWVANQYNPNPAGTATANMFRAGVLLSTVTGNAAGGKEATLNLNVGNYSSPDNLFFIGNILEFGINGKELTSDDLANMNAYCQARYGI